MQRTLLLFLAAAALFADSAGIPPRKNVTDYPAHESAAGTTPAAALLPSAEIRSVFAADLDHAGYLVFEVAVYPQNGVQIDLGPDQFTLRANSSGSILASLSPDAIVNKMYHGKGSAPQAPGKVAVTTTTVVGWESGGQNRRGGVYAGQGTAVGVGDPPPGSAPLPAPPGPNPPVDRDQLLAELTAREFPETKATAPVAGYLYFPKADSKPKSGFYELTYTPSDRSAGRIVLQVPAKNR